MLRLTMLVGIIPAALGTCAQNMVTGEYWVDTDPGFGAAFPFDPNLTGTPDETVQMTINPDDTPLLLPGTHTVGYRTMDDSGRWSLTNLRAVYIAPAPLNAEIIRTEYFLNTDPFWGNGHDANVSGSDDLPAVATTADLSDGHVGMNTLFYRTLDAERHWSITNHVPLYIADSSHGVVVRAESFWDVDPGFGGGDPLQNWTQGENVSGEFYVYVPDTLTPGNHKLYIRSLDSRGRWSLTNWKADSVSVEQNTGLSDLSTNTGISVFPNPFTDAITVQPADAQPLRVILYDPQGKLVHDEVLNTSKRIDLSGLSNGAYTAFFWKDLERIHRVTVVKQ